MWACWWGIYQNLCTLKNAWVNFNSPTVYPGPRPADWSRKGHQKWKKSMLPLDINKKPLGIQLKGTLPFEQLEVDFTEMKPCRHYRYLLIMLCTFSGWVEAFPTWTKKTNEEACCLLQEIIPRFRFLTSIGSDNSPAIVAKLIQQVCKALNIKWKLHTAYRPQSSRMVERTNRTLKETLSKCIIETDCSWIDLLLAALLKLSVTPHYQGYSPYVIVCGRPLP